MDKIQLNAHAKINLSLEITGKRPDGYHEIVSLMQGTGLHDIIEIRRRSVQSDVPEISGVLINGRTVYLTSNADTIPTDMGNLALKAVKALADACGSDWADEASTCTRTGDDGTDCCEGGPGIDAGSLLINIDKRLPVAAGIAGGSGNAAACLLGVNELLGRPFTLRELMDIGAGIGADVPFSVFMNAHRNREVLAGLGGIEEAADAAMTSGIGDIVVPVESIPAHIILANPGVGVSTREAYEAMDAIGYTDPASGVPHLFANDMERFTLEKEAKAAELKKFMIDRLGADRVLMSGSGPTMVAYYQDKDEGRALRGMEIMSELTSRDDSIRAWLTDTGR